MELQIVSEGSARIYVQKLNEYKTSEREYVPSRAQVFYNPLMKTNRDVAVAVLRTVGRRGGMRFDMGDPLAGVGVRSIRALLETSSVSGGFVNDSSEKAVQLMRKNIELNRLGDMIEISSIDANAFLSEHSAPGERFGYVDLDPFGSPSPFLDNAVTSVTHRGFIAVTATDTPVLYGVYPRKMKLVYDSYCPKLPFFKEVGARVLIAAVARAAARHEIGVIPLMCYAEGNHLRGYFQAFRSRSGALSAVENVGYVALWGDPPCWDTVRYTELVSSDLAARRARAVYGPMWVSRYIEENFMGELCENGMGVSPECDALIEKLRVEDSGIFGYFNHEMIAKACGGRARPMDELVGRLRELGVRASRTVFDSSALKANVSYSELATIFSGNGQTA